MDDIAHTSASGCVWVCVCVCMCAVNIRVRLTSSKCVV